MTGKEGEGDEGFTERIGNPAAAMAQSAACPRRNPELDEAISEAVAAAKKVTTRKIKARQPR
ncbi:MAG: hypothetical protein WB930_13395 [Syntrophobacteraceae bacterium]